jgi:hypothetical protein
MSNSAAARASSFVIIGACSSQESFKSALSTLTRSSP